MWLRVLSLNVFGVEEGLDLETPIVEFYYKTMSWTIHSSMTSIRSFWILPMMNKLLILRKKRVVSMITEKIGLHTIGLRLIDFKLEFGFEDKDGRLSWQTILSKNNCRLWDAEGHHMDRMFSSRDLGSLTDVYQVVGEFTRLEVIFWNGKPSSSSTKGLRLTRTTRPSHSVVILVAWQMFMKLYWKNCKDWSSLLQNRILVFTTIFK